MMNQSKNRFKHGLTIEYAVVMMTLGAAFIALILTTSILTTEHAVDYQDYVERKIVVDDLGSAYIQKYVYGKNIDLQKIIDSDVNKEENGLTIVESPQELAVHRGRIIELHVSLGSDADGNPVVLRYVYGAY